MKASMRILLLFMFYGLMLAQSFGQTKSENHFPFQSYFEDSSHVFWTGYPSAFLPVESREPHKWKFCSELSFYCDLAETVTVVLLAERDSAVYSVDVQSAKFPLYSVCYWVADSELDKRQLPSRYIRNASMDEYKVLLMVGGRKKCIRNFGIRVRKNWYCWIEPSK